MLTVTVSQGTNTATQWQQAQTGGSDSKSATAPQANPASERNTAATGDESALAPRLDSETADTLLSAQQAAPSAHEVLTAMDTNGDGLVDTSELAAYATLPPAAPPHGAGGAVPARKIDDMPEPDKELEAVISALSSRGDDALTA